MCVSLRLATCSRKKTSTVLKGFVVGEWDWLSSTV